MKPGRYHLGLSCRKTPEMPTLAEIERDQVISENETLRAALWAIVDAYGRDPEIVHIPAKLISLAEAALEQTK